MALKAKGVDDITYGSSVDREEKAAQDRRGRASKRNQGEPGVAKDGGDKNVVMESSGRKHFTTQGK